MDEGLCELTLKIRRDLAYLYLATGTAKWICQSLYVPSLTEELVYAIELTVSEACTNAIKHALITTATDNLIIEYKIHEKKFTVIVKDQGPGYDFDNVPLPDFDEHPEGGYGIFIIKSMMDEVEYYHQDGFNNLRMVKYLDNK